MFDMEIQNIIDLMNTIITSNNGSGEILFVNILT